MSTPRTMLSAGHARRPAVGEHLADAQRPRPAPLPEWQKVREFKIHETEPRYPWGDRHDEPRTSKPGFATPAVVGGAVIALAAAVGLIAWAAPMRPASDRKP